MTIIVGLTGGIGSGKTLISDRLGELGAPIIDTDVIARVVVEPGQPALGALVASFGNQILVASGELNRDKLRELAFSSSENKQALDSITHPAIRDETIRRVLTVTYPYCVVVIPLLTVDSAFSEFLHRVLTVSCSEEVRIQRVMARNNFERDQVLQILRTQLSDEQREAFADDIIHNDSTKDAAIAATDELHEKYVDLSQSQHLKQN